MDQEQKGFGGRERKERIEDCDEMDGSAIDGPLINVAAARQPHRWQFKQCNYNYWPLFGENYPRRDDEWGWAELYNTAFLYVRKKEVKIHSI